MKFKSTLSFLIKIGIVIFSLYFLYNELVLKINLVLHVTVNLSLQALKLPSNKLDKGKLQVWTIDFANENDYQLLLLNKLTFLGRAMFATQERSVFLIPIRINK